MIRLKPTTITITAPEMSDAEQRSRYRKYLVGNQQRRSRRRIIVTTLEKEEATVEHVQDARIQTPDVDSTARQEMRSSSSPDPSAREEMVSPVSSPDTSIRQEANATSLPVRTRLSNIVHNVIEQDDGEDSPARQLVATIVSVLFR